MVVVVHCSDCLRSFGSGFAASLWPRCFGHGRSATVPIPATRTAATVKAVDSEETEQCYRFASPLAFVLAVPEAAVMTRFNSFAVIELASDCSVTSGFEVSRATDVAQSSDCGTIHFGCCSPHLKLLSFDRRQEGFLTPSATIPATISVKLAVAVTNEPYLACLLSLHVSIFVPIKTTVIVVLSFVDSILTK